MTLVKLSPRRSLVEADGANGWETPVASDGSSGARASSGANGANRSLEPGFEAARPSPDELEKLRALVSSVPDPELGGVTIGELGLVHTVVFSDAGGVVEVTLLPTFLGCPALKLMERDVVAILRAQDVSEVRVTWVNSPSWSPNQISPAGRLKLAELGIAVPGAESCADGVLPVCPICSAAALQAKLPVGPTACRSVAWCTSCRSVVEIMRGSQASLVGGSYAYV